MSGKCGNTCAFWSIHLDNKKSFCTNPNMIFGKINDGVECSEYSGTHHTLADVVKRNPYVKDIRALDTLDIYRVLVLYNVTDPCVQHAVKKLLCAGQRGVKDFDKDIQEAMVSLTRLQEMKQEDLK